MIPSTSESGTPSNGSDKFNWLYVCRSPVRLVYLYKSDKQNKVVVKHKLVSTSFLRLNGVTVETT